MSTLHTRPGQTIDVRPSEPELPTARAQALLQDKKVEVDRFIVPTEKECSPSQTRGEIVVQCLEGQATITTSAQTENLRAGELLFLPAGEPHSVKGIDRASLLLSIEDPELKESEQNETIHARGVLLSVLQAAFMVISLALLFVAAASNVFVGVLVVGAALVLFGCLHYWVWGRWMSPALLPPERKELH